MSRTFRRKTNKKHNTEHFEKWALTEFVDDWLDIDPRYGYYAFPRVNKTGKDYDKAYWKFHGDDRLSKRRWIALYCYAIDEWRTKNKQELHKFLKNPDYEVMSHELKHCAFWEYP